MKVLIVGDIHWSTYSSILRSRGNNFSTRLEYLIKSLNWVEQVAKEKGCEEEVFLGDFFDKPDLTAEEISALSEINWVNTPRLRHFLVGNHDSGVASLVFSSTQALYKVGTVEDAPYIYPLDNNTELLFLPYITEDNRKPLKEYLTGRDYNKKLIIFSHNDIKDFQMGMFLSTTGFKIEDILDNCDLYINGHLHNGGWVSAEKILNLGNLTGQNFSEDAFRYEHHIGILDTNTLEIEFIENPYAMNFYKIEINIQEDIKQLYKLKPNAILSINCLNDLESKAREVISSLNDIVECRFILHEVENNTNNKEDVLINKVDHLEQFKNFILENYGNSDIIIEELNEVCK